MQAGWVTNPGGKKDGCLHVQNANATTSCNLVPTGIKFAVYTTSAGTTLDATMTITAMTGGAVHMTSTDCSGTGNTAAAVNSVALFATSCNGNVALPNNTRWDFRTSGTCKVPAGVLTPGAFFELNKVSFGNNFKGSRKLVITLYYGCDGFCTGSPPVTETFTMIGPP